MKTRIILLLMFFNFSLLAQDQFYRFYTFEYIDDYISIDSATDNLWKIGAPNKEILNSAYSDSLVMITSTNDFYQASNTSIFEFALTVPNDFVSYGGFGDGKFTFKHKYDTETNKSGGYVEISYDNGRTWTNAIIDKTTLNTMNLVNMYAVNDTLEDGTQAFQGTTEEWIESEIWWWWNAAEKLDQPEGWGWNNDTLKVRFVFKSLDGASENYEGWMIDDLEITIRRIFGSININNSSTIKIYPNPSNDILYIEKNENYWNSFKIIDAQGKVINNEQLLNDQLNAINISNLKPGIYILVISNSDSSMSDFFIKK